MEVKRREFLKILGASTAGATLAGCVRTPPESLIPYLVPAEEMIPGKAVWYATVCRECPAGCGLRVRVREGRAVKVEGNPEHPINRGGTCARGQASLQGLYNPDRIQHPMRRKPNGEWEPLAWEAAEEWLAAELKKLRDAGKGSRIAWMSGHETGSLSTLIEQWLGGLRSKARFSFEPIAHEALRKASELCFGAPVIPTHDFAAARMVLAFGADFLETWLSPVAYARGLAEMRQPKGGDMGRFIYVGPRLSMTACNADEWIAVRPHTEAVLALGLVHVIVAENLASAGAAEVRGLVEKYAPNTVAARTGVPVERIRELAGAFAHSSPALAVGSEIQVSAETGQALAVAVNLLNYVCGNIGKTVHLSRPYTLARASAYAEVSALAEQMSRGEVAAFLLHEANPAFSTPQALRFGDALKKVPLVVSFSSFMDETTAAAHLVLPSHTPLESWGDYEAVEGIHGLMQPVMLPVFQTQMLGDTLLHLAKRIGGFPNTLAAASFYDYLRAQWAARLLKGGDFEEFWRSALMRGGIWPSPGTEWPSKPVTFATRRVAEWMGGFAPPEAPSGALTLVTYPSLAHYDGRGANRPWLQELPDPVTQLVWGNCVELHPEDAAQSGIANGDLVEVASAGGAIELPAYVHGGIHRGFAAIPLGQGHTHFGRYANGVGANAFTLLGASPAAAGGVAWSGVRVTRLTRRRPKASVTVSGSRTQDDRDLLQIATLEMLKKGQPPPEHHAPQMYPPHEHPQHRWGMTIDLNRCTGCSACVVACYAENNIPVAGREEVAHGRELSWIRIERYYRERSGETRADFLPMLCQQCDNAPCEPVCPVYASYHSAEGLNGQVYNRCIGTRYCSHNCPYKVRRFNWRSYEFPEPLNWQLNPDVTVRTVGVMEKCTFCVQRIQDGKLQAAHDGRPLRDGEITPACAQACPAQAIVFGDLKDPESRVNKLREEQKPRGYRVLEELNTQPAIVYLKEVRPTLEKGGPEPTHG